VGGPAKGFVYAALTAGAAALAVPAVAGAGVRHVVGRGETLWSIAYANNFTTRALAAANGLSPDVHLVRGSTITIPTVVEAAAALRAIRSASPLLPATVQSPAPSPAPAPMGAYTVQPGDTLSELAARSRIPLRQLTSMNGLDPARPLLVGTVIKLPTGSPVRQTVIPQVPRLVPGTAPIPTPERVTAAAIAPVATRNGVPASLVAAIAWQESGFNNAKVSAANARGVMQILPGTWDWVQRYLARRWLNPALAIDNVAAGVLFLGHLLRNTGGDPGLAAAGYYQGLRSVQRIGMLSETRRYVANVLALRSRFGGL
jgi:soluble lytic murein transglycosylase-like protein